MNERDFVYWLKGFLELSNAKELDEKQVQIIKDHIALTMIKVTPNRDLGLTRQDLQVPDLSKLAIIC